MATGAASPCPPPSHPPPLPHPPFRSHPHAPPHPCAAAFAACLPLGSPRRRSYPTISESRSSSADWSRPYGHTSEHICSRKNAKSNIISSVTAAKTANATGCVAGVLVKIHEVRRSAPTNHASSVFARCADTTRYTAYIAARLHGETETFGFAYAFPRKNRSTGRYTNSMYTVCGHAHPHQTRPKIAVSRNTVTNTARNSTPKSSVSVGRNTAPKKTNFRSTRSSSTMGMPDTSIHGITV